MIPFGQRLNELRQENNMMQKELAALLGISYRQLQRYENGTQEPSIRQLILAAHHFDVSMDYLLGLTEERRSFPER